MPVGKVEVSIGRIAASESDVIFMATRIPINVNLEKRRILVSMGITSPAYSPQCTAKEVKGNSWTPPETGLACVRSA